MHSSNLHFIIILLVRSCRYFLRTDLVQNALLHLGSLFPEHLRELPGFGISKRLSHQSWLRDGI